MNSIDAWVRTVESKPYQKYDKWWVDVIAYDGYWPHDFKHNLIFDTEEEALLVKEGYTFLA